MAVERFGRIGILVNNAAVFPPSLSIEVSEELWDPTLATDLKGAFFLTKFASLDMIKDGRGGGVINVLSTEILRPTGFLAAYGAAKAGVTAVTQSMVKELGEYGILVNAVIPGATMTAERLEALKSGHIQGPFPHDHSVRHTRTQHPAMTPCSTSYMTSHMATGKAQLLLKPRRHAKTSLHR